MSRIYVLHENSPWIEPLNVAFAELGLPFEEWFLNEGRVPFDQAPPEGVFYNRMSASSHTRGHRFGPELAQQVLTWLKLHGRRVANNHRALCLEVSKLAQYAVLARAGVQTPRSAAAVGNRQIRRGGTPIRARPLYPQAQPGRQGPRRAAVPIH